MFNNANFNGDYHIKRCCTWKFFYLRVLGFLLYRCKTRYSGNSEEIHCSFRNCCNTKNHFFTGNTYCKNKQTNYKYSDEKLFVQVGNFSYKVWTIDKFYGCASNLPLIYLLLSFKLLKAFWRPTWQMLSGSCFASNTWSVVFLVVYMFIHWLWIIRVRRQRKLRIKQGYNNFYLNLILTCNIHGNEYHDRI